MDLDYIKQINAFWTLDNEHRFTGNESRLYFYLLKQCNSLYWKNPFTNADSYTASMVGVTVNTLKNSRNRLQEAGLLEYKPGGNGARDKCVYTLVPAHVILLKKVANKVSNNDTLGNNKVSNIDTLNTAKVSENDTLNNTNKVSDKVSENDTLEGENENKVSDKVSDMVSNFDTIYKHKLNFTTPPPHAGEADGDEPVGNPMIPSSSLLAYPLEVCAWNYLYNPAYQETAVSHLRNWGVSWNLEQLEEWVMAFNRSLVADGVQQKQFSGQDGWIRHLRNWVLRVENFQKIDPKILLTPNDQRNGYQRAGTNQSHGGGAGKPPSGAKYGGVKAEAINNLLNRKV